MTRRVRGVVGTQMSGDSGAPIQGSVPAGEKSILVMLNEAATYEKYGIVFTRGVKVRLPASMKDKFGPPWFNVVDE